MANVIVLEGPDGGGKTTLANHLVSHRGFNYVHTSAPKFGENLLVSYALVLDRAIRSGKDTVIDRLHIGEQVYGPIYRGTDRLTDEGMILLKRIIIGGGVSEVFCMPPYQTCYSNWFKRRQEGGEMVKDSNMFFNIYEEYRKKQKSLIHARALHYDYTKWNLDDACVMLTTHASRLPRLPQGVIGTPTPVFLIVGEIANQNHLDIPWIDLANSSHYLNQALWDAGFIEEELAFVNAKKLDETFNDFTDIQVKTNFRTVISFGTIAQRWTKMGFRMPHPAYWKRFHSLERREFVDRLAKIRTETYNRESKNFRGPVGSTNR